MTPFGIYLENLRRSRRIQQKQLADLMGINPCYVSTLERGRKGPPSAEVLNRLIKNLNLSRDEQEGLWRSVELSEMCSGLIIPDTVLGGTVATII
ncbi:XRE family transcriptional regulator [Aeromonas caviae]|nr:XRE family transcriptional regulator [Aeromonas caviae]